MATHPTSPTRWLLPCQPPGPEHGHPDTSAQPCLPIATIATPGPCSSPLWPCQSPCTRMATLVMMLCSGQPQGFLCCEQPGVCHPEPPPGSPATPVPLYPHPPRCLPMDYTFPLPQHPDIPPPPNFSLKHFPSLPSVHLLLGSILFGLCLPTKSGSPGPGLPPLGSLCAPPQSPIGQCWLEWLDRCLFTSVNSEGKGRKEAQPTCVHSQHGLHLLDPACQLLLLGPGVMELGPSALEGGPHCGGGSHSTKEPLPPCVCMQPTVPS